MLCNAATVSILGDGGLHPLNQILTLGGRLQEVESTLTHGADSGSNCPVVCQEDHGNAVTILSQAPIGPDPTKSR